MSDERCTRCGQERAHLLHEPAHPLALVRGVGDLKDMPAHPFAATSPTASAATVTVDRRVEDARRAGFAAGQAASAAACERHIPPSVLATPHRSMEPPSNEPRHVGVHARGQIDQATAREMAARIRAIDGGGAGEG